MNNQDRPRLPEPNPFTRDRHQRQILWQVFVPMGLAVLVILALSALVATAQTPQVQRLSDVSIIFLILPTAVIALVILVIFAGLIFLMAKLIGILPLYARLAQITLERITTFLKNAADSTTKPVVGAESAWAGVVALFRRPVSNNGKSRASQHDAR
jgi:lysylphosphatidylglycerol synthetase-like protein (DUF2156 family)